MRLFDATFSKIAILVLAFSSGSLYSQVDTAHHNATSNEEILASERDIVDVYYNIFPPKLKNVKADTVIRDRKIYSSILPGFGYSILTNFTAVVSCNFSFYVNRKKKNANISSLFFSPEYGINKQLTLTYQGNIFTNANKWNLVSDWRYYHYSANLYPLGHDQSRQSGKELIYFSLVKFHQLFYRQVYPDFLVGAGYKLDYHWNIRTTNNLNNPALKQYLLYGDGNKTISSGIVVSVLYDKRRNSNNPVGGGVYGNIEYRDNLKAIGSTTRWRSIFYDVRKYFFLPRRSKSILAFWHFATITVKGRVPYLDLPSTMWDVYDNAGRPYIQGRFRSRDMFYFETEYRFKVTKNGLFGGALFANLQVFSKWPQNSFFRPIPGTGVSLRIKANKKSKVNFVISYGVGIMHAHGFFFNVGDVF